MASQGTDASSSLNGILNLLRAMYKEELVSSDAVWTFLNNLIDSNEELPVEGTINFLKFSVSKLKRDLPE